MKGFMLMSKMLIYIHYFQKKNVLYVKTPAMLAVILISTLFCHCMNYEAVDCASFN